MGRWPKHIRTRLTLWYILVLAALLVFYSVGTSLLLMGRLKQQLGVRAIEDLESYIKTHSRAEAETNITATLGEFMGDDADNAKYRIFLAACACRAFGVG